jgi:hypothetical protein
VSLARDLYDQGLKSQYYVRGTENDLSAQIFTMSRKISHQ